MKRDRTQYTYRCAKCNTGVTTYGAQDVTCRCGAKLTGTLYKEEPHENTAHSKRPSSRVRHRTGTDRVPRNKGRKRSSSKLFAKHARSINEELTKEDLHDALETGSYDDRNGQEVLL